MMIEKTSSSFPDFWSGQFLFFTHVSMGGFGLPQSEPRPKIGTGKNDQQKRRPLESLFRNMSKDYFLLFLYFWDFEKIRCFFFAYFPEVLTTNFCDGCFFLEGDNGAYPSRNRGRSTAGGRRGPITAAMGI